MRSSGYRIEPAKFRHLGTFNIFKEGNQTGVPEKVLIESLQIRFAWLSSTGLGTGESSDFEIQNNWRRLVSDSQIVFRYFQKIYDYFTQKRFIKFSYQQKEHSLTGLTDPGGESIYLLGDVQSVQ